MYLFLVAINGILEERGNVVNILIFADDLPIYIITRNKRVTARSLQGVTKNLNAWAAERGLTLLTSKKVNTIFRKIRKINEEPM